MTAIYVHNNERTTLIRQAGNDKTFLIGLCAAAHSGNHHVRKNVREKPSKTATTMTTIKPAWKRRSVDRCTRRETVSCIVMLRIAIE